MTICRALSGQHQFRHEPRTIQARRASFDVALALDFFGNGNPTR